MYYYDEFGKEFEDELSFHEYLEEIDERAKWIRVPSRSLSVLTVSGHEVLMPDIENVDMKDLLADTKKHSGLLLQFPEGMYPLGKTAVSTLKDRARIKGTALMDVKKTVLADILNECLQVSKGEALLRISEGKVRGVLSGDEADYAIISMPKLFMIASAYISGDHNAEFSYAYADHNMAQITSWQDFLYQSGCDTKSLLPMVRRSEIRERAERYYLQNGSLADIHFIPQISLEASFSDAIYLLFLEYGEQAAEKIARQWIKRNIPYISQQRILYGCVRDEFREILDTPNDRIHKIKHLIQALNETRHKAVQVILCRKKKVIQVNMSVEELCNPKGYYSIRGCSQKDRATLERMFGKTAEFRIEDIQSVSYGGIVLYENVASRNAA